MTKRLGFKPTFREQLRRNEAASRFYALSAGVEPEPSKLKPKRERAAPRDLEGPVVAAIKQLLACHPRVLIALRMNAGSASYEAKSGRWAPVKFHEWLRYPEKMRMPDFVGFLIDGTPFALEAKNPSWKKPTDDREREQEAYLDYVRERCRGIGAFVRSVEEAKAAIESP